MFEEIVVVSIISFLIWYYVGIEYNRVIYSRNGKIQSYGMFDIVVFDRSLNHIVIHQMFGPGMNMKLVDKQPGYRYLYIEDGQTKEWPYEEGTPFKLTSGKIVCQKAEKSVFGISYTTICESTSWPMV